MNLDIQKDIANSFTDEDQTYSESDLIESFLKDVQGSEFEIRLYSEVEEAIGEKEIILLRNKLKNISNQTGSPSMNECPMDTEAYFGLSEEVFNAVNLKIDSEEYEVGNYLQKLHIKNHAVASKEIVHDLFSELEEAIEIDLQTLSAEDEILFEDIKDAVSEKEIVDLRANLKSIAQSVSIHEHTFEEIEDFVNGELDNEIEIMFREEAMVNSALSYEIDLHSEINKAIEETDIMRLRAALKEMIQNEYSHSRSIDEIDEYLNDQMDEEALALLEDELMANSGLADDLAFHREVDKAIAEADIMALRTHLQQISRVESDLSNDKLGLVPSRRNNIYWYAAASIVILMLVFSSLMQRKSHSDQELYASYYQGYSSSGMASRSALVANNGLNKALYDMDKHDFHSALKCLENIPLTEQNGFTINYYSGIAYQQLGEYNQAINSYSKVVQHGDNLLVEQSEWYIGLCYLRIEERQKAIAQFKSIVSRKGYYRDQSSKILKQLE